MKDAIQISKKDLGELNLLADSILKRAENCNKLIDKTIKDIQMIRRESEIENCINLSKCNQEK